MSEILLSLKNITKSYGSNNVLNHIHLHANKGEFVTLLGSSGCGKTTLLRVIAGFEQPDSGDVILNGVSIAGMPPNERKVNTVFQNYALFPHMNVYDNIAYGPKIKKTDAATIRRRVADMLSLVKMEGFERRMPSQMSGGERQRIAIARALINAPDVLLLDEPLGALDLMLRQHMQGELKRIQKSVGITFIYVTHDQEEALYLSDKIAVMHNKRIEQFAAPNELYRRPKTLYTAQFVGERNIFGVKRVKQEGDYALVDFNGSKFMAFGTPRTDHVCAAVLFDAISVSAVMPESQHIKAVLTGVSSLGSQTRLTCAVGDAVITATLYNKESPVPVGQDIYLCFKQEDVLLLEGNDA